MTAPRCSACSSTLTGDLLMPREGQVMVFAVGGIPYLYNGVVCKGCGRVECTACQKRRGQMGDTPCRWCGDRVMPAFDNNVGMYHRARGAAAAAPIAAGPRRLWPRWSDLFYAPIRLIGLAFFLLMVVVGLGLLPTLGLFALLVRESYGPLDGDGRSVYWIASTFNQRVFPYIAFASWGVGLVALFVLTLAMDGFWRMMHAVMTKPEDPSLNPSRLEVGAFRLLTAAGCIALVPLPVFVSFTRGADAPPTVVCRLTRAGMELRGAEVLPGEVKATTTTGGSGGATVAETKKAPALGGQPVPAPPKPVSPEQLYEGKLGGKVERTVAWKDVTSVWFTSFKDSRTVLHWTNAAGREEWLALPAHVQFATDGGSPAGWAEAAERFAPQVLLLDRDRRLLWPVLDAATARTELAGRLKSWNLRGISVRGKVRGVKLELDSWHKREEWRKVNVTLAAGPDDVRCTFGKGYISEGDRKKENPRLDRAAELAQGQDVVVRGTVVHLPNPTLQLIDCVLLDVPAKTSE